MVRKKFMLNSFYYSLFINGVMAIILGSLLPMIKSSYNLDYSVSGMLLSAHSMGNLIAGFIAGVIPVYIGKRKSIILLCSSTCLGFVGMVLTGNPLMLVFSFLLTGIGRGSASNYGNSMVAEITGGNTKSLNILHSFFAVGAFIAPYIAILFTRDNLDYWKFASLSVAAAAAVMVILFVFCRFDNDKKEKSEKQVADFSFFKNPHFLITTGILFFYLCTETAINGWLVTYFKDSGIMSINHAQKLSSLLWIVILFGRLFCAYISNKVSKRKILLYTSIGSMVFFILLLSTRNLYVITSSIIGLGFCMAGIYPTTVANVGGVIKNSPMAMGSLLAISGIGSILMPSLTGIAAESIGIAGGMGLITVSAVLNLVFSILNYVKKQETIQ